MSFRFGRVDLVNLTSSSESSRTEVIPPKLPELELLERIGSGGYGEVWLCRNALGALRAVKIVRRAEFDDARPYEREFKGIRSFEPISRTHEGFVDILQVGRNEAEGWFYYVMELADPMDADSGEYQPRTLASELKRRGALPLDECIQLALSLARGLSELHRHDLVHRDIKPSNIIFVNGAPKLADIGLVASATESRSFVGTEGFIPPEGPGTPQADIYSLGILLYVMATGKHHRDFPEPPANLATLPPTDRTNTLNSPPSFTKPPKAIRVTATNPPQPSLPTSNTSPPATPSNAVIPFSKHFRGHGRPPLRSASLALGGS